MSGVNETLTKAVMRCHKQNAKCDNIYHVSKIMMEEIVNLINCDSGFIALHENNNIYNTGLHFLTLYSKNNEQNKKFKKINFDKMNVYHQNTKINKILETKKSVIINDFNNDHLPTTHIRIKNFMGIPLCDNNKVYGLVSLTKTNKFTDDDKDLIEEFLSMVSIILYKHYTSIYRYLFDVSFDLTCISNLEGNFIRLNPIWQEVLGYSMDELYKMKYTDLLHEDDREKVLKFHHENGTVDFESRFISKDGSIKWLSWRSVPIKGKFVVISTVRDITDKKEAEIAANEAFRNLELALSESNENNTNNKHKNDKNGFVSLLGHELKSPLNAILGFGQLLQFSDKLKGDDKRHVDLIVKSGMYLLNLINDIVDISKLSHKSLDINMDTICVNDVIEDVIELINPLALGRHIDINYDDVEKIFIYADEKRLKQSIINLVSNAIKYNKFGGYIDIETKKNCISIKDSGIGISKENQDKLFIPFERLDVDKNKIKGTGLGLVLTKKLVESMNGKLMVDSTLNKGSTFSILFKTPEKNTKSKQKKICPKKSLKCSLYM